MENEENDIDAVELNNLAEEPKEEPKVEKPKPLLRMMDNSQIAMIETFDPKVKAIVELNGFVKTDINTESHTTNVKNEYNAIAMFPVEYLESFFKLMRGMKKDAPSHVKLFLKNNSPIKLEFNRIGDADYGSERPEYKTTFWLAPRIENV